MSGYYGCGCGDPVLMYSGGLGAAPGGIPVGGGLDPTGGWTGAIKSFFDNAWATLEGWLGIGDGRTEADLIVPLQNAIGARLAEIVASYPTANLAQLTAMYAELLTMEKEFTTFVHDPRFTDGRASSQALYGTDPISDPGMLFLLHDNEVKIAARITQMGGTTPSPTITYQSPYNGVIYSATPGGGILSAGMDTTTMLFLGGLALAFFMGKK